MSQYFRKKIYSVDEVLPYIITADKWHPGLQIDKEYGGEMVHMNSARYQLFATKEIACVKCGLKGEFFALETHRRHGKDNMRRFHFNLYAIKNGKEIMMTKDHIIPADKGGQNNMENLQVMCEICNCEKGNQ